MKNIWKDPVWSKVIAGGILAILIYLIDFWPLIWKSTIYIVNLLKISIPIPIWLLIVVVPTLLIAVPLLKYFRPNGEPRFTKYTYDNIFDINWSWRWIPPGAHRSSYQLSDLTARCPTCHSLLTINNYDGKLVICINEHCNWKWKRQQQHGSHFSHSSELNTTVHNEIDRRIHSGEKG
jgi:hypothetical protein